MTQPFEPKKSYRAIKAHEGMTAFTGFRIFSEGQEAWKEGILKIAASDRPYRGDYLTLTFILDTEGNSVLKDACTRRFKHLTEASLKPYLGKEMERLVKVSLDDEGELPNWYVEEINIYFRKLEGAHKTVIEQRLIPAFEKVLKLSFQPVEWWPQDRPVQESSPMPEWAELPGLHRFKTLLRKWFDLDSGKG